MQITIGNLYPYELTLYGENGNLKALKYALEKRGVKVEIVSINKEDKIDFKRFDFVYVGSGRRSFLDEISGRLEPFKDDIIDCIKKGKVWLATGNAIRIFDFLGFYEVEEFENRKVADVEATTSLCKENIKGFQNTEFLIKGTKNVIFNMNKGFGNGGTFMEGVQEHNFYATSIIGPILARNDNLVNYFVDVLLENK